MKELIVREEFWTNQLQLALESLASRSRYSGEMEILRKELNRKTEIAERLAVEIDLCKLELRGLPRVTVADEPYIRPRQH